MKALFRFYILAGKEGLSQPDAARKAQAQVEQHAEQIAQLEAEQTRMLAARDAEERQRARQPSSLVCEDGEPSGPPAQKRRVEERGPRVRVL